MMSGEFDYENIFLLKNDGNGPVPFPEISYAGVAYYNQNCLKSYKKNFKNIIFLLLIPCQDLRWVKTIPGSSGFWE